MNANIVTQTENVRLKRMVETLEEQNSTLFNHTLELEEQLRIRMILLRKVVSYYNYGTPIHDLVHEIIALEPPWYDNISDRGVLCWVGKNSDIINIIKRFDGEHFVCINSDYWTSAKPLTNEEITAFIN